MQDFKQAYTDAKAAEENAGRVTEYLGVIKELMEACDEVEGAAKEVTVDGEKFVQVPFDEWLTFKGALCRAW